FCIEACYLMRDRFLAEEVWRNLGLPDEAIRWVATSRLQRNFQRHLFIRIVPILREIGLWGPRIREAFTAMGVMELDDADVDAAMAHDETFAEDVDRERDERRRHVEAVAGLATA